MDSTSPRGFDPEVITQEVATLLLIASIHRRRCHEGRTTAADRQALAISLGGATAAMSANDQCAQLVETIAAYLRDPTADHASTRLDELLAVAFAHQAEAASPQPTSGWVKEVNPADGFIMVELGDTEMRIAWAVTLGLPWWMRAQDMLFELTLPATGCGGSIPPPASWASTWLAPASNQLLDDDAFLSDM